MKNALLLFTLFVFIASGVYAQKKVIPLITDRPDYTNSATVLPPGYVQIESGLLYNDEKTGSGNSEIETQDISFLGTLVRVGLSDLFELRIGGEYLFETVKSDGVDTRSKGLNALMVGTKFQFLSSEKSPVDASISGELYLPFGSSDFKPDSPEPRVYLAVAHDITDWLSVGYNLGTQYDSGLLDYNNFYSISFGINITDKISLFAEHYGTFMKTDTPNFFADFGILYQQNSNIQVDLYFGKEITISSNAFFMGAGFVIRLPD